MAITISGENNNDRILAQDGVIDSISGFNIAGIITASSFTGDLTGDVTGNLTGNVTGNINNTTLLLQTGGSERVRIASDGKISTGALASPDGNLHVYSSSAGSVTAASDANELVLESSANVGMSFLTATNSLSRIKFGDSRQSNRGVIAYNHGLDSIVFHTVGSEKLRITSGGTIGINDSSPNTYFKLDVNGHTNIVGDVALPTTNRIYWGNSDTAFIKGEHGGSAYLAFGANNEKMRLTRAGYLGIGTDNPGKSLEIFGTDPTIKLRDSSGDAYVLIEGDSADQGSIRFRADPVSAGANTHIRFDVDGTEALRIDSNGRVLIGHSSTPQAALSVAVVGSYGGSSTPTPFVYLCRDEDATSIGGNESLGQILFASRDGYRGAVIEGAASGAWSGSSSDGYLVFKTTPDNATVPTEKLRIASTGNVSINTTNVTEGKLQVNGDVTAGYHHGGGMYGMLAKRKFQGGNALGGYAIRYGSGYESPWIVGYNAGASYDNQITFGSMTTSDRSLETGVTKRMVIDMESGSVGIGTATIASNKKLDICNGIVSIQGTGSHDSRYEFVRSDTGAMGWIGIPNWNPAGLYIYAPTATSNEIAASYGNSAWNFFTGGSSTRKIRVDSGGRTLFRTNGSVSAPITDDNVPVQIAESSASMCYFSANKGSSYGALFGYHTAYGGTVIRNVNSDDIVFYTNNTSQKLRLTSAGHLQITTGNLEFANGSGIDFSNVPSTSGNTVTSDGNKFDDYEEGTYNPTRTPGNGNITATTSNTLRYVKVGRLVHLVGRLHFNTNQNDLSSFTISLPFANTTGNQHDTSVCTHVIRGNGGDPVQGIRIFRIGPGGTTMYMNNHEGQSYGNLGTTSPHININFSYFAA